MWPTPNAHDGRRPGSDEASTQGGNLKREAEQFALGDTSHDNGGGESLERKRELGRLNSGGGDLQAQVELWGTPNANERTHSPREVDSGIQLANQADQWQTPASDSFRSRGGDRVEEKGLDQQARFFPTPSARDHKSEVGGASHNEPLQPPCGSEPPGDARTFQLPAFAPGPNSPNWRIIVRDYSELTPALCDFDRLILALRRADLLPVGVERDPKRLGKALGKALSSPEAKSRFRALVDGLAQEHGERTSSLRVIGNGVVPIQGAAAFTELMRRINR